ncbi:MarR family transcriptional regulator [Xanthobacter dioxanivorans]|uniref:MarR family transcriptional regulator n=1 Tax=Xanthobacter dioxanivorans TaxID=2528964 RepID=A0A974PU02_9HYPH|nr:MarR family transcriptional regulator [Xanthobacter dioxanivorans]QRG09080.1 MarR family transcriptional regulator [Xanthobacter dioxanivorans]
MPPRRTASPAFIPPITISRPDFLNAGSDRDFRDSIFSMVRALDGLQACREVFAQELGLTGSQFAVLIGTAYREGTDGVTIRDLAEHVRLAAPHVTTEVGRLVRKGLMTKRPHLTDRRSVLVSLTPEGEAEVRRVAPLVRRINDILFESISRADLDALTRAMKALIVNSERALAEVRWGDMLKDARAEGTPAEAGDRRRATARTIG